MPFARPTLREKKGDAGEFEYFTTAPVKCACANHKGSMKTIGAPAAAAKPEVVPSLFVLNSRGATLQGDTLTLTGVSPSSIIFADRPVRSAGHQPTAGQRLCTIMCIYLTERSSRARWRSPGGRQWLR